MEPASPEAVEVTIYGYKVCPSYKAEEAWLKFDPCRDPDIQSMRLASMSEVAS
jgi:hypothetical protein